MIKHFHTSGSQRSNLLTQSDIEFLQETQYRQDLHRSMMEAFLVVIRRHPDAAKKNS